MRKFALAAVAAVAFATPAMAQEVAPFTGFRAEGVVGWDRLSDGTDQDAGSSDGVLYGAQFGYDIQAGRAIVGIEGEVTGSTTDTRADNLLAAGDRVTLDVGRDLYVGGRVGVAVSPNAMIYAKGGYTNLRIDAEYRLNNVSAREGENFDGYRLGAGVEYKLSGNTYLKGEYRYSNYGSAEDYDDIDLDRHQLLGGIGVRF
jgi:outer membrane immunogenic protein